MDPRGGEGPPPLKCTPAMHSLFYYTIHFQGRKYQFIVKKQIDDNKVKKRPWVEYPPIIVFKKLQSHFEKAYSIALLGKSIVHTARASYSIMCCA